MTTTALTDYTRDTLAAVGVTLRRNNVGLKGHYRYGIKDWPDLIGYGPGGVMWCIEIKNAETKDKARGKQLEALAAMRMVGCVTGVVRRQEDVRSLMDIAFELRRSSIVNAYPKPHT